MAITFLIQSKRNPAPIYIRLRSGREIDAKCKIDKSVNPEYFSKGKVKTSSIPRNADAKTKKRAIQKNDSLIKLQSDLDTIRQKVNTAFNNRKDYETINGQWLTDLLHPKDLNTAPKDLVSYFDYYFKVRQTSLKPSTIKKMKVFQNRIKRFEKDHGKVYIQEVNTTFKHKMEDWCDIMAYAHNTKVKTLKVILTVCNHAKERGVKTHPELEYITKDLRYERKDHIHLTFDEIDTIANIEILNERLDNARDWLVISCHTAQRVSDFLRFTKNNIVQMEGMKFLDITQEKTTDAVYIPLTQNVIDILNKRNGEFPPIFSDNADSNKALYNGLIKKVCKIAGIDTPVKAYRRNKKTNRYETKTVPKYKAVSSHIGRRSFATNYYGKIDTALLRSATGHASERQFLDYVGKAPKNNALSLAKAMRELAVKDGQQPQLRVVKTANE